MTLYQYEEGTTIENNVENVMKIRLFYVFNILIQGNDMASSLLHTDQMPFIFTPLTQEICCRVSVFIHPSRVETSNSKCFWIYSVSNPMLFSVQIENVH